MASRIRTLIFAQADFPAFLEDEIGVNLISYDEGKFKAHCPFPYHRDNKPSFSVDYKNGGYMWFCYGCGEGGTVVEFFQKYYGISSAEAINRIIEYFDVKEDFDAIVKSMRKVTLSTRNRDRVVVGHLMVCTQIRTVIRECFESKVAMKKVRSLIEQTNEALENGDERALMDVDSKLSDLL